MYQRLEAVQTGNLKMLKSLLANGCASKPDVFGRTPLFVAAIEDRLEMVKVLVEHGAPIDQRTNNGTTPLLTAAYAGHLEIVKVLLAHGASVDIARQYGGATPLLFAVEGGHLDIVKVLVEHGASIDQANIYDSTATPLFVAAQQRNLEIVKVLVDHGAKVIIVLINVLLLYSHLNIQVTCSLMAVVCKSSKREAFQVATELITRGVDLNEGCPLNVAIQNRFFPSLYLSFYFSFLSFSFCFVWFCLSQVISSSHQLCEHGLASCFVRSNHKC
jgi:Ankyrin repeats (3 copies)/Ankyrin repeats (many copies)